MKKRSDPRMQYQLTLFSGENTISTERLDQTLCEILEVQNVRVVAEDEKITATFSSSNPPSVNHVKAALKEQSIEPVGIALLPANQEIKIAFFDMDSTIIQNECIDEMARKCDELHNTGSSCYDAVSEITKEAMKNGTPFEEALAKRIAIIVTAGFKEEWLEEIYNEKIKLSEGAEDLLAELKAKGIYTVLVSGGFSFFTQRIKEKLGFDEHYSNELLFDEKKNLTGVSGSKDRQDRIVGKEEKAEIVHDTLWIKGIPASQALFGGDGGNDAMAVDLVARNGGVGVAYDTHNEKLQNVANAHLGKGQLGHIADLGMKLLVSKNAAILVK
jgi:phosphoserine phosphatase